MALAYRSGLSVLGRLPQIAITLPNPLALLEAMRERLEELRDRLAGEESFFIDNGMILRAVPKKKPSYRRTRQKLYAPGQKQIQPLENLVRCPACGRVKRSHFMCMHCFGEIRTFLKEKKRQLQEYIEPPQANLDKVDETIVYPGKRESEYQKRLRKKDWIPTREEPLLFDASKVRPKK